LGEWTERAMRHAAPGTAQQVYAQDALVNHRLLRADRFLEGTVQECMALGRQTLQLARQLGDPEALLPAALQVVQRWRITGREEQYLIADEFAWRSWEGVSAKVLAQFLWYCGIVYLEWGERDRFEELGRRIEEL